MILTTCGLTVVYIDSNVLSYALRRPVPPVIAVGAVFVVVLVEDELVDVVLPLLDEVDPEG